MTLLALFGGFLWIIPVALFGAAIYFFVVANQKRKLLATKIYNINESLYSLVLLVVAIVIYLAIKKDL